MDDMQQRVNQAAEKFAAAILDSYRMVAENTVSVQQLNAELTQSFFNGVIENLRAQAEGNQAVAEELAEQQQRQQETARVLARESVGTYMSFLDSMFAYYQANLEQARRGMGR